MRSSALVIFLLLSVCATAPHAWGTEGDYLFGFQRLGLELAGPPGGEASTEIVCTTPWMPVPSLISPWSET